MGKGGGCIPSKKKAQISAKEKDDDPVSIEILIPENNATTSSQEGPQPVQEVKKKLRVFIVFYSMYGHVEALAKSLKKGVDSIEGVEGVLYRIPETLPEEVLQLMKAPQKDDHVPLISAAEKLVEADGLLFGFPTRYGSMAAQMKAFFDSTGQLWREQKLAGVPAGFFISTGTQGGGQETTAWTAITQLVHHGMLYVPIGYTFGAGMFDMDSIRGGSPYGAGVYAGDGTRQASETELALAEYQGKYMASTVKKLAKKS
ncbi:probable NAD(P)H dehydrogenase (quinone) FQR1-like 2 isoform X1 [Gastrolobium bilobum]|uniref:probable NAD(P)H dehydrogenase (quinone) FQR1-like 2 isoform X1 n=1 Tax=Gastrolobium bilobum TaxID=150636 RepID=UPI002AAFAE7A|nr:probable NAD(P)H dehydrogenase (quinone) FQR1-like 2 isoform X1 [Gastrolobium bilobum]